MASAEAAADPSKSEAGVENQLTSLFSDRPVRHAFVRKVYALLSCQLVVTCGFIALFVFVPPVRSFAYRFSWLYIIAFLLLFIIIILLACYEKVRRSFPLNLILLGLFTVFQSFALGVVSARFSTDTVLIAVGVTTMVVVALTAFAIQTRIDFTYLRGILFVFAVVLLIFGVLCSIFPNRAMTLSFSCLGAFVFSMYIVVDTQLMLGGKHQYAVSQEEYVFATLNLYVDIVNLFISLLTIISAIKD